MSRYSSYNARDRVMYKVKRLNKSSRHRLLIRISNVFGRAQVMSVDGSVIASAYIRGKNAVSMFSLGKDIATKILEQGIKEVVLDRGKHKYVHDGKVGKFATAVRESGVVI